MPDRANRSNLTGWYRPTVEEILAARIAAGLTQTAAGALVCSPLRTWQDWEAGKRRMPPMAWELFQIKAVSK